MLEALGAELLGQVLRHLPPADVRSARLAARIFDEASRQHLESSETLKLCPANAGGARGGPDWTRFPLRYCTPATRGSVHEELQTRMPHTHLGFRIL